MFDLSYSLRIVPEEDIRKQFNELRERIVLDDNVKILIYIKNARLYVLSHLKSIIAEICDCLICKSYQAAITLTNHLFENALKQTLMMWDSGGRCFSDEQLIGDTFKNEVEKYDNNDLEPNINQCKKKGIISKKECERLKKLKNKFRNPFSHASYTELFANEQIPMWSFNLNNSNKIREEVVNISTVPLLTPLAQVAFAKANAAGYFLEVYALINDLDKKLLDLYPETKQFVESQQNNKG